MVESKSSHSETPEGSEDPVLLDLIFSSHSTLAAPPSGQQQSRLTLALSPSLTMISAFLIVLCSSQLTLHLDIYANPSKRRIETDVMKMSVATPLPPR